MNEPDGLLQDALGRHQQGRFEEAATLYERLLAGQPDHADGLHLLGVLRYQQGRADEAIALIRRALDHQPGNPDYLCNLSAVLRASGDAGAAESAARAAHATGANVPAASNALGGALQDQGRFEEALNAFREAVRLAPDFIEACCNLASLALDTGRSQEAEAVIARIHRLAPGLPLGFALGARLLEARGDDARAAAEWRRAVEADPMDARLHFGLGSALENLRQWDQALEAYLAALERHPGLPEAINGALFMTRATCSWERYPDLAARFREAIGQDAPGLSPFVALAEPLAPEEQLRCARTWSREKARRAGRPDGPPGKVRRNSGSELITVGYLTSEFRRHPTAYTKVGLFERHDRSRFRVIGYCNGDDDGSDIRRRIVAAVDEFVDLRGLLPGEVAERIRRDSPDILVDLKGHTENALTEALALRPAPVQASWVGFPGSTGADFIDYAVVDPVVVPEDEAAGFSESLIWLPETYWAEDDRRARPGPAPSRTACGLPENAVVLACFNNSYKLHPATFDLWMSLLRDLPGTVLWLQDTNPGSGLKDNLRREAAARRVAPERIVFCPRLPLEDYLARYRVADLFIDTLPYNAHTTAADALWTGLPVVTLPGRAMASRVAASLLGAAGLGDLVARTGDQYRSLIANLVREPGRLAALKADVIARVPASPLFDTARFTRHFESALAHMARRSRAGLPPAPTRIALDPQDQRSGC